MIKNKLKIYIYYYNDIIDHNIHLFIILNNNNNLSEKSYEDYK